MFTVNRRKAIQFTGAMLAGYHGLSTAQPVDKTVRFMVAYAAGGASDMIIRYIAERIRDKVGSPIVIDNRPGADGNIAAEAVAKGTVNSEYLMLVSGSSTHATNATIYKELRYDPERDFRPLTTLAAVPHILVVNPARFDVKSMQELIAKGKAAQLSFASSNVAGRVAGERFKALSGIDAVNVPYASSPQAMTDLLGGHYDFIFADAAVAMPLIQSGKIRPLAVSVLNRLASLPDVPTVSESGIAGFEVASWIAAWSSSATPPEVANRLASWINGVLDSPEGRKFLTDRGLYPFPGSPEKLQTLQRRDTIEWGKVIKANNMQKY